MHTAAVEDREARLTAVRETVVPDEGRAPAHLTRFGVREEAGDDVIALREVLERAEVGLALLQVRERGEDREAEDRKRDDGADGCTEADGGRLEESRARVRREWLLRGGRAGDRRLVGDGAGLRLDRRHLVAHVARDVTCPQDPERDCENCADGRHDPGDDEAQQHAGDPDREADRPQARPGCVRGVVTGIAQSAPCRGFNRPAVPRVNDVTSVATR